MTSDLKDFECKDFYLTYIKYHKVGDRSESGIPFLIGQATTSDALKSTSIKGEMANPMVGENYRLWGNWETDPKFGEGFRFFSFEILSKDTGDGL